ncbi:hypothetical protein C1645_741091 [Glomus cerebriforme]|uniref:RING-type domain-containing protein n=1 Tax=Glomus cerebriforme TaxID=658196 RepID=A0A397SQC8_9GLOM|nr:hypothetical protein C1645_741091 [Glomus cerebriforme]
MENQESENLSTTNDYNDLGDLIYYDDDDGGGGGEKNKIMKPCKPSLINHRNIAYNILKYLEDDMVDCGKNIDIIVDPNSIRRGLQSSQSSKTLALTNLIGEKFVLNSPVILEEGRPTDPMDVDPDGNVELMSILLSGGKQSSFKTTEVAKETSNWVTNPKCEKCFEDITIDLQKDTAFLSCKHAVHLDCINDLCKRCPTCTSADDMETDNLETSDPSGLQKKCSNKSTEKSSSKKAKKSTEKKGSRKDQVSDMLKKLIKELSSKTSQDSEDMEEGTGDFFDLYNTIINMEG